MNSFRIGCRCSNFSMNIVYQMATKLVLLDAQAQLHFSFNSRTIYFEYKIFIERQYEIECVHFVFYSEINIGRTIFRIWKLDIHLIEFVVKFPFVSKRISDISSNDQSRTFFSYLNSHLNMYGYQLINFFMI